MIKLANNPKLERPAKAFAICHMGKLEEGSDWKQDITYKQVPRFRFVHYKSDLKHKEHPPEHKELMAAGIREFAGGDPMKFNNFLVDLMYPTAEQNFVVNRMNAADTEILIVHTEIRRIVATLKIRRLWI